MRIRKRKVPFPLSSLSPVPLSDPPFSDLLQPLSNPDRNFSPEEDKPSDQPSNYIGDGASLQISSDCSSKEEENKVGRNLDDDRNGGKGGEKVSNDSRKETISGAKAPMDPLHQEKAFPLKKKRGSLERRKSNGETMISEKDKKTKSKLSKSGAKKRVRGGGLMEGSRCSRVNGRGWRCCQPTLVGYSLCEHHLGKGRLRSMTSVRSRSVLNKDESRPLSIDEEEIKLISSNEDEKQQQQKSVSKRQHKLGMVKARSISSLLSQADNAPISTVEENED